MAKRENAGASTDRGQDQHSAAASGTSGSTTSGSTTSGSTAQGSGTQASGRRDQERQMQVTREGGGQRGSVARRQQPSLLPSLFAAPPGLLTSAFLSDPFDFMRRMSDEMNQIFEGSGFGTSVAPSRGAQRGMTRGGQMAGGVWFPQVDVRQRGNELLVHADLPGIKREDVNIEVEDGVLTVSGERRQDQEEDREGLYRSERSYGSFYRAIPLPEGVNEDQISASFNDGVLEIRVPLPEQQQQRRGRRIEINTPSQQQHSQSQQQHSQAQQHSQSQQQSPSR